MESFFNLTSKCKSVTFTIRILLAILFLLLVNVIALTYQAHQSVIELHSQHQEQKKAINEARWQLILAVIKENREKALIQANAVKDSIESRLLQEYNGDLSRLKDDLTSDYDNRAFEIMNEQITDKYLNVQNDNNDMFIISNKRIVADRSLNTSYSIIGKRTLDDEAKKHTSSSLCKESTKLILTKYNGYIFWKFLPDTIEISPEDQLVYPSLDGLKALYNKYGVKALDPYGFLVPAYIKKNTDMFGEDDITNGIKSDNHKIIVVQEFNISNALEKDYKSNLAYFTMLEKVADKELEYKLSNILSNLFMYLCLLISSFIGIFLATKLLIKWGGDDVIRGCKG